MLHDEISGLIHCSAAFLPGDPARSGRIAFWDSDGGLVDVVPAGPAVAEELTVLTPALETAAVPAVTLPVGAALPLLTRIRAAARGDAGLARSAPAFWGAAALLALEFAARGLLLPGLTPGGHDSWRVGPLDADDLQQLRNLAAAMPPDAHCVPLPGAGPARLPAPEELLRPFLDAVADTLPRSPAAAAAAGGPAFAAPAPHRRPEHRAWADEVAAAHDAGIRLSLRIEVSGLDADGPGADPSRPVFRGVLQLHSLADPSLVADAADVWTGRAGLPGTAAAGGPRPDALLALRRAVRVWPPLAPLLGAAVPDAVVLDDEDVAELLGRAGQALAAEGFQVHWPRQFARELTARAVIGLPDDDGPRDVRGGSAAPALFSPGSVLAFDWRFAIGGEEIGRADLDRLAEAKRPLVRLRDQWVLIDPRAARRALTRQDGKLAPVDALAAVLTGSAEVDGVPVPVAARGDLELLRAQLADPEAAGARPPEAPAALAATLRDYQLRGLDWLARTTALGLGCCLADDMGLGKTVTLIALHLHRQQDPATAGPTLVVCPASLMGNWQREIERFAPGTAVHRFHGSGRRLPDGPGDGFVLTTYGTMRLDAADLAGVRWGLVVADEAQHVKNPRSGTARALRTIGARARVALTGTPVENSLSELWAVLDWTTPGLLGRQSAFRNRYAGVESGTDPQAAARLAALVRPFLLRRRKSDPGIAPELPAKTETDRPVALTAEQTVLYEAVVRETLAEIAAADGFERRGLVVKLLTSLKQICNHPAQYLKERQPRLAGRSGKLELFDELLDTILAEDGAVLVFTQYVALARLVERHLAERGIGSLLLHGATPLARRQELVDAFQAGAAPVFLLSLRAAGTGLNLTRAGHVVHFDRWWNPAVEDQATDRAYRIGQTQPVQVHRLIAEGTVEDRIARLLERKRALADAVLRGGESALTELTDEELAELVALGGGPR
ncbi:DEAD/DEAH box helicase [Streptomyces bambusae]|uniref:DEAD/DEAH box helicase n=1 Tax=Streptomyces bambusae TaxID=1550616 RepID=UPI001CFD232A|nr:DEAD/DEAH box helicase [Streptomyces bambusae]MCB5168390.1 DEAD/DEAH box helicase [Streptomyces bambusae]